MHSARRRIDRRRVERAAVKTEAHVHIADATFGGRLLDLCDDGALVRVAQSPLSSGQPCILTIPFGRDPAESIALLARVVWREGDKVALRWARPLSFDARFKFTRLIEREIGEPKVRQGPIPMVIWPARRRHAPNARHDQDDYPSVA
jgi:PilZ domain-containing protein